ncbi:MAG: transposase [Betaproteobacteria bacterium]
MEQLTVVSTNTLERLNHEIGRRAGVVCVSPNRPSLISLTGGILQGQSDEPAAVPRRYFRKESRWPPSSARCVWAKTSTTRPCYCTHILRNRRSRRRNHICTT